eukprot:g11508.t1
MAEADLAHLHLLGGSEDTDHPDDTGTAVHVHVESISDDGMGVGNENVSSSSSFSSHSTPRLSVATDMACSGVGGDIVPPVLLPPSIEEQVSLVRVALESSDERRAGQTRFLVAKRWMRRWEDHVGWNSLRMESSPVSPVFREPPGPITNREILEDDGKTLRENQEFQVEDVDARLWELLSGWFGGNPIQRLVVMDNGRLKVELYQLRLTMSRKGGSSVETTISKSCTVGDLRREGIAALQIGSPEECEGLRLHVMTSRRFTLRDLDDDEEVLGHVFSLNDATVQFDLPGDVDDNGGVSSPQEDGYSSYSWGGSSYFPRPSATPGVVGLQNLGNTCFMNAAVQCLSHIPQVVDFFGGENSGQHHFLHDLNIDNPLGTKGELARAFGDIVRRMWEGKESCVYPREFRSVLCDHAQQFLGYEQHDSQEFLAYLLDGIHEDVNRVRDKPFVEKVEAYADESDVVAADRSWEAHLQRNQSFIVDTMHGQLKSVVTCPVEGCKKTSTTFDPAMYLSLPVPVAQEKSVEVVLVTPDGRRPRRYVVWVSKTAAVKDLRRTLAKAAGKREDRLAFAEIWLNKFHEVFEDDRSLSDIRQDELFAFELLEWPEPEPLPPTTAYEHEYGLGGTASGSWEQKLAPFLMMTFREKKLQAASDADGRFRMYKETKRYLARFPSPQELQDLVELASKEEVPVEQEQDGRGFSEAENELNHRLRQASVNSYPFVELSSPEKLAGFSEAAQSLEDLVLQEQRNVTVQIVQYRSIEYAYGRTTTTPFSFPLLASYRPLSTTIGEFRSMLAVVLRRFVLPRDAAEKDNGMDLDGAADDGESAEVLNPPSTNSEPGADSDTVMQLFRSGGLELLTEDFTGREINILGGGDCRDEDQVSESIEESASCMSRLKLRWSEDALREAYDATEVSMVEDDSSVALSRNRLPKKLSVSECVDCFLEREQLDDTEMWYCSSCKEHRRAFKLLEFWRLPPVLIIHLKRFSYDTYGGWAASREKIEDFVTFPVRGLDMQHLEREVQARAANAPKEEFPSPACSGGPEVDQHQEEQTLKAAAPSFTTQPGRPEQQPTTSSTPAVYDLWGVVNHYGGLGGGHYTAYALNVIDKRWYEFSDDRVSVVDNEADLVTSAAYVLFYSRRKACSNTNNDMRSEGGCSEGGRDSRRIYV